MAGGYFKGIVKHGPVRGPKINLQEIAQALPAVTTIIFIFNTVER
jgi:hypothetical protein